MRPWAEHRWRGRGAPQLTEEFRIPGFLSWGVILDSNGNRAIVGPGGVYYAQAGSMSGLVPWVIACAEQVD